MDYPVEFINAGSRGVDEQNELSNHSSVTSTTSPSPEGSKGKSKKGLKRFPRVLKAILFETSLAKKIRKRRNAEKKGANNECLVPPENLNLTKQTGVGVNVNVNGNESNENGLEGSNNASPFQVSSTSSNSLSMSSSSALSNSTYSSTNSSTNSTDKTLTPLLADVVTTTAVPPKIILVEQEQQKEIQMKDPIPMVGKGRYSSNVGLCLVVVSLVVLLFWGKICAIIFTSTWLFFVPHCIPGTSCLSGRIEAYYRRIDDPVELKRDQDQVPAGTEGFVERNCNRARRWVGGLRGRS